MEEEEVEAKEEEEEAVGEEEEQEAGGDKRGSQSRDPQELPTAPAPSFPHPTYQNQQRFTPGSISDISQGPPIPPFQPIPQYY